MYTSLVPVFVYMAVVQLSTKHKWRPLTSTLIVVFFYQLFTMTLQYILSDGQAVIGPSDWFTLATQLLVGYVTFWLLEYYEESYLAWFGIAIAGMVALFGLAPYLAILAS